MNDYTPYVYPQGFIDNEDSSKSDVYCLARGSYNVVINDKKNIASRKGFTLFGVAGSQSTGIKSAVTWDTNTNKSIPMRTRYNALQAYYGGQYRDVLTGLGTLYKMRFSTWWDKTEIKDKLLAVNGTTVVYAWTGGMTEIASWTVNSVSKKYAKAADAGNSFTFASATRTITQSTGTDFVTLGFVVGDTIRVLGTVSNNGIYTISNVAASVLTLASTDVLTNEVIVAVTAIVGVLGKETWAAERFTSSASTFGAKTINIAGSPFTYNAGWDSPTLTLTTDPSASATVGGFVFQVVNTTTPSGGDFGSGQIIDLIAVNLNQLYVGYSQSRVFYFSKQAAFNDMGYSSPVRKTGEGGTISMDNNLVSLAVEDGKVVATAGKSDVYEVSFENFSDGTTAGEIYKVDKKETNYGQSAASQESFVKIKNGTLYLSNEPTIDFLGNVELIQGQQAKPLSYPIKRLLNSLNRNDVSGVYTKNSAAFLFPNESLLLLYDVERGFWQPPQYVSGQCLSVGTDGSIIVHSAQKDESYTLFSGMTDNGSPINFSVVTNIIVQPNRTQRVVYDEIFTETLVNGNATSVDFVMASGYRGAVGSTSFSVGFNDDSRFIEEPAITSGFGTTPFGTVPNGGLFPDVEEDSEIGRLRKLYEVQGTTKLETFSNQLQVTNSQSAAYFEIISWGFNKERSDNSLVDIMK